MYSNNREGYRIAKKKKEKKKKKELRNRSKMDWLTE